MKAREAGPHRILHVKQKKFHSSAEKTPSKDPQPRWKVGGNYYDVLSRIWVHSVHVNLDILCMGRMKYVIPFIGSSGHWRGWTQDENCTP